MKSSAQLYGYGMLVCGYAAGMLRRGEDWTHIPWQGDMAFGVALLVVAYVLEFRKAEK